jgi:Protein of unknown function (DUF4239)
MSFLTGLYWWILFPMAFLIVGSIAILARAVSTRLLQDHASQSSHHASPLMPTLGALFAFLSAFVIAAQWTNQSSADSVVSRMSTASARLAWASTEPGASTIKIQAALANELTTTARNDWEQLETGNVVMFNESQSYRVLQQTVRESAYSSTMSAPAATELLSAVDEVGATRHELADAASRSLPTLLLLVLALSGIVLTVNAVLLTVVSHRRAAYVVTSVVILVSLDLALLLVLAAPFRGTLQTSPKPITAVVQRIQAGFYSR